MIENDSANETNRHEKIVNLIFVVYTLGPGPITPLFVRPAKSKIGLLILKYSTL